MIKFAAGMVTMAILALGVFPFMQKQWSSLANSRNSGLVDPTLNMKPMNDIGFNVEELTVELAERLTGTREAVTFWKLTSLEPEVAAVLARHPGNLSLPAINQLTPDVAKALVHESKVIWLGLDGLKELSPDVARELATAKCAMRLGIDTVTPEVAEILATGTGSLALGLKSISPDVAGKLAMYNAWIQFASLATIDAESAAQLAKLKDWLTLDGLESLTPEVAKALGSFDGSKLDLNGLKSLNLEVAKELANAKCSSGLYLNGLTEISPDVINVLANGNSHLSFQGLEFVDSSVEQALVDAEKKLQAMGKHMLIRKSDQPLLMMDSHHQQGSNIKGETLSHVWKIRGQSVGSIGVRALHIKEGNSHVVSEGVFPVATQQQQSMELQLQLKSLDEPLSANGTIFVPSLSVAVNGITINASEGEKFTMLGEFTTHSFSTGGQRNYEDIILRASNDANGTTPSTIESMISTSKKGGDFFVVILTWQPSSETNLTPFTKN